MGVSPVSNRKMFFSLEHFYIESASLFEPTHTWVLAGQDSLDVKKAAVVNWMQLGVYQTREKLLQFRKIKTDWCVIMPMNPQSYIMVNTLYNIRVGPFVHPTPHTGRCVNFFPTLISCLDFYFDPVFIY